MIIESQGSLVGAIGVSGAPSGADDDRCAQAEIEAIREGLEFQPCNGRGPGWPVRPEGGGSAFAPGFRAADDRLVGLQVQATAQIALRQSCRPARGRRFLRLFPDFSPHRNGLGRVGRRFPIDAIRHRHANDAQQQRQCNESEFHKISFNVS